VLPWILLSDELGFVEGERRRGIGEVSGSGNHRKTEKSKVEDLGLESLHTDSSSAGRRVSLGCSSGSGTMVFLVLSSSESAKEAIFACRSM